MVKSGSKRGQKGPFWALFGCFRASDHGPPSMVRGGVQMAIWTPFWPSRGVHRGQEGHSGPGGSDLALGGPDPGQCNWLSGRLARWSMATWPEHPVHSGQPAWGRLGGGARSGPGRPRSGSWRPDLALGGPDPGPWRPDPASGGPDPGSWGQIWPSEGQIPGPGQCNWLSGPGRSGGHWPPGRASSTQWPSGLEAGWEARSGPGRPRSGSREARSGPERPRSGSWEARSGPGRARSGSWRPDLALGGPDPRVLGSATG